jgi:hypothetical protein
MKASGSKTDFQHVPSRPVDNREPVKVDVFGFVIRNLGLLQLAPVFPYLHDGAIVPCLTNTTGVPSMRPWHFFHDNEAMETIVCLVENGAAMKSGQIMLLANHHGVGPFLRNPHDPSSFYIALITMRMHSGPQQTEGIVLRCHKCNEVVYSRHFNVKEGPERKHYPEFYALRYYLECFREFNEHPELRICKKCSTMRAPEPECENFGYLQYTRNIDVANRGREAFEAMAAALTARAAPRGRTP